MTQPEYRRAIDISNYSGVPTVEQFQQVKDLGYDLVICGTQRTAITQKQLANALVAGLDVELYVYLYWDTDDMWHWIQQHLEQYISYPIRRVWLDCEQDAGVFYPAGIVEKIQEAVDGCEPDCGIYTGISKWDELTANTDQFEDLPLWYAYYDGVEDFSDFQPFGGWTREAVKMKQYKGDGRVAEILCDLNVFRE